MPQDNSLDVELDVDNSSESLIKVTPMLQQYLEIKNQYQDHLVFFRLGDFYELFFDDAKIASNILGIVLTARKSANSQPVPMCGIPHHSHEAYLAKLIKAEYKVVICEQTETPQEAAARGEKIVNRAVVRIVTRGTLTEDKLLSNGENNYLACIAVNDKKEVAVAYTDISTGEFTVRYCSINNINSVLQTINVSEILLSVNADTKLLSEEFKHITTIIANEKFNLLTNSKLVEEKFGMGLSNMLSKVGLVCCGVLLDYIQLTQKHFTMLKVPKIYNEDEFVKIDYFTHKSLELTDTYSNNNKGSLKHHINATKTAMGSRLLGNWLASPLKDISKINQRLDVVEFFINNKDILKNIVEILKSVADLERILGRMSFNRTNISDLYLIRDALRSYTQLKTILIQNNLPNHVTEALLSMKGNAYSELLLNLETCLLHFLPSDFKESGFFKPEFDIAFYKIKQDLEGFENQISQLQQQYSLQIGYPVKINYLNNLGYCIEINNKNAIKVQTHTEFSYKGSTTTNSRYTTRALQDIQDNILFANELKQTAEKNIFNNLVTNILTYKDNLIELCGIIAKIDLLSSFAMLAINKKLVKPTLVTESNIFKVINARHLVVEEALRSSAVPFIANDCIMTKDKHIFLITGPNMGGKSTFLRQNALIVVMAQIGCFVAAQEATLSVVDAIFSRVGASDDLSKGQSTFMVEMLELANILNNATHNSFIILDEIGRGTSTYDGISIAWATLEYLNNTIGSRCLFATHHHELLDLQGQLNKLDCYYVKTVIDNNKINFMYSLIKGHSSKSYGIKVAQLAGLPSSVIAKANNVIKQLELNHNFTSKMPLFNNANQPDTKEVHDSKFLDFINEIAQLNADDFSAKEALIKLYTIVQNAQNINNTPDA